MAGRQRRDAGAQAPQEGVRDDQHRPHPGPRGLHSTLDLLHIARGHALHLDAQGPARSLDARVRGLVRLVARVPDRRDPCQRRQRLPQQFETLAVQIGPRGDGQARDVSSRTGETGDQSLADEIPRGRSDHDRHRRGRAPRRHRGGSAVGHDDVDVEGDQLRGQPGEPIELALGGPKLDTDGSMVERQHPLPERLHVRLMDHAAGQPADAGRSPGGLSPDRRRPQEKAAGEAEEKRATVDHATTLAAATFARQPPPGSRRCRSSGSEPRGGSSMRAAR